MASNWFGYQLRTFRKRRLRLSSWGLLISVLAAAWMAPPSFAQTCTFLGSSPNLVRMDSCGVLHYFTYRNRDDSVSANKNTVPDFSYAGYRQGAERIPLVTEKVRVPLSSGDATTAIQNAIDTVGNLAPDSQGFRGAVVLEKGIYRVDGTLVIDESGVVLRGQGQHLAGTILVTGATTKRTVIRVATPNSPLVLDESRIARIRTDFAGVGTNSLFVDDGTGFNVGDVIAIRKTPNQDWIYALGMDLLESMTTDPDVRNWEPEEYRTLHLRKIVYRSGGHFLTDIPLVDSFYSRYGGGEVLKASTSGRIQNSGVEDLRIISSYKADDDEDHGWNAVHLYGVENAWVRRVTAQNFGYSAVNVGHSSFVTVEDTASLNPVSKIQGSRRYSFNVSGNGVGILFQRVYSDKGRHNFVTGARVVGPHVWVDSVAFDAKSDDGPHHRWATGLLFDNILTKKLNVQNRTTSGTGHGWSGAQVLFWRSFATDSYALQAAPASMNLAIGMGGTRVAGKDSPTIGQGLAYGADAGQPRSLYFQQLENRAGTTAVKKVTTALQRKGRARTIISLLREPALPWADPACANGIASSDGSACCSLSCGQCGGSSCSSRDGGAESCCIGRIQSDAKSCLQQGAPCNIEKVPAGGFQTAIGDPICARGIYDSSGACCALSCGSCGGSGCSGRPGGAAACCTGAIGNAANSCLINEAPCLVPAGAR